MIEVVKVYVFFHSANANEVTVKNEYQSALDIIALDGGTVMTVNSYVAQGNSKVSIIYKSSKPS